MIDTSNLAKEYGARVLFEDVTLQLHAGRRTFLSYAARRRRPGRRVAATTG